MKTFRVGKFFAFGAAFALVATLVVGSALVRVDGGGTLVAADSDGPTGFSGYLLDKTGLDGETREPDWRETFESPGVSWRYLYQDGDVAIRAHRRVSDVSREGASSEFLRYEVRSPGVVVFGHYVDYPFVFEETNPSVWVRSDRPGVSLAAIVVFPKTLRPDDGKPLVAILPGATYNKPGEWSRLDFPRGLSAALDDATQALRAELRIPIEKDGAYVRQLALVSEARSGRYSLWIDDLEVARHTRPDLDALRRSEVGASFDPVDLLSCRLRLSKTPIFAVDSNGSGEDEYGEEPFGIDFDKVAQNERPVLRFAPEATPNPAASKPDDSPRSTAKATAPRPVPSFADAAYFLPSTDPLATSPFDRSDRAFADATPANADRAVGQVGFVREENSPNRVERIATAAYPANDESPKDDASNANADGPADELVSGSGTLANSEDAATDDFARPDRKLVADARFRNGLLESPDGRAFEIRAIESQGESLSFLKGLGFNAILTTAAPTAELLKEANSVGVWIIAPPPIAEQTLDSLDAATSEARSGGSASNESNGDVPNYFDGRPASAAYDAVLLWYMGEGLRRSDAPKLRRHLDKIRSLDPRRRPIIGSALDGIDECAQTDGLNALILNREPLGTSLDLNDYGRWLIDVQNVSTNPSVAYWNRIQTQTSPSAYQQRQCFGAFEETPALVSYEQTRQLVRLSARAGCRGLIFSSRTPLDAKDKETQYRAKSLELINLELSLLAPWRALGSVDSQPIEANSKTLGGFASRTERAVLVEPISTDRLNQFAMGQCAVEGWSGTVAVREGYVPDLLTPGALRKIVSKRRAGGVAFELGEGSMNTLLFFTQSDSLTRTMTERAPQYGRRMAELAITLAKMRLDLYEAAAYRVRYVEERGATPLSAPRAPNAGSVVSKARAAIAEAEKYLELRDESQAYLQAERATREIRAIEREFWERATRNETARPVTPLSTSFYDAPDYLELYAKINSGRIRAVGDNLIRGGDMEESASAWNAAGWSLLIDPPPTLQANVDFDRNAAKSGAFGLRVEISPKTSATAEKSELPVETESASVVVEAPYPCKVGQTICVQGWIKIPQTLKSSVDGVEIYDSLGGRALALRFKEATGWRPFAFYRRATNDGTERLRFAFSGVGEVYLDDVSVRVVE